METVRAGWPSAVPRCVPPLLRRVLIVDPDDGAARALVAMLRTMAHAQVWTAADESGLELAASVAPTAIFVEQSAGLDGGAFVAALRRARHAAARAAVVMMMSDPTVRAVIAARECGAHEALRKPVGRPELIRRLESVALAPRAWIETADYVGPDRRCFHSGDCGAASRREGARGGGRAA